VSATGAIGGVAVDAGGVTAGKAVAEVGVVDVPSDEAAGAALTGAAATGAGAAAGAALPPSHDGNPGQPDCWAAVGLSDATSFAKTPATLGP